MNTPPPATEPSEPQSIRDLYYRAFASVFSNLITEPSGRRLTTPLDKYRAQLTSALRELEDARAERFAICKDAMATEGAEKLSARSIPGAAALANIEHAAVLAAEVAGLVTILRWSRQQNAGLAAIGDEILTQMWLEEPGDDLV